MLPHDELYHYGVRGMRWGIRRRRAAAASLEKGANTLQEHAKQFRSGKVPAAYGTHNKYYNHPTKGKKRRDAAAEDFEGVVKYDRQRAAKLRAKANKMESSFNQKMKAKDRPRHKQTFADAVFKIGTGIAVTGIGVKLVGPTADIFGNKLATYVNNRVFNTAGKAAAEAAAKKAADPFGWIK